MAILQFSSSDSASEMDIKDEGNTNDVVAMKVKGSMTSQKKKGEIHNRYPNN